MALLRSQDARADNTTKGIAAFTSTDFTANNGLVDTVQNISNTGVPQFAALDLTSSQATQDMLDINNTDTSGGGSLLNLEINGSSQFSVNSNGELSLNGGINGQTIDTNSSFTGSVGIGGSLSVSTISSTGSTLSVGNTSEAVEIQGNASSDFIATSGADNTTVGFQPPTAKVTYDFASATAGTYNICTTTGNCAGVGGGVVTPGGTSGTIAMFTGGDTIANSIITQSGTTATIGGTLAVNTITPTAALTIGSTSQNLTLQGATVDLTATSSSITNTLTFATPSGSNNTITIPDASGTVAVSASGPLALSASGNLTCSTCLTSSSSITLQQVYNGSAGASPDIDMTSTNKGFTIQNDYSSPISGNLFSVNASVSSGLGSSLFSVANTGDTSVTSSDTTGSALSDTANSITTGIALNVSANGLTTGSGINIATTSALQTAGSLLNISDTASLTTSGGSISGSLVNVSRSLTANISGGSSSETVSSPVASFSNSCTLTDGTCSDASNVLSLNQQYTNATGAVAGIQNSGTGFGLQIQNGSSANALTVTTSDLTGIDSTTGSTNAVLTLGKYTGGDSIAAEGAIASSLGDYAEYFPQAVPGQLQPGDVVCFNSAGQAELCSSSNDTNTLAGVVSTSPGFVGNNQIFDASHPENTALISMVGQVPVHVSDANGPIQIGDMLTFDPSTGLAVKATSAGMTVGEALDNFDSGTGTIQLYIHIGYYDPMGLQSDGVSNGYVLQGDEATLTNLTVSGNATIGSLNVTDNATISNLTVTASLSTDSITVSGHIVTDGVTPSIAVGESAGNGTNTNVAGDDTSGKITFTLGSSPSTGDLINLTFSQAYASAPNVVLSAGNSNSAQIQQYVSPTATGFSLNAATSNGLSSGQTYTFYYHVIQ